MLCFLSPVPSVSGWYQVVRSGWATWEEGQQVRLDNKSQYEEQHPLYLDTASPDIVSLIVSARLARAALAASEVDQQDPMENSSQPTRGPQITFATISNLLLMLTHIITFLTHKENADDCCCTD